jgi:hypothetical protein
MDDERVKKWGAWGGDRKLSPRYLTRREAEERLMQRSNRIAAIMLFVGLASAAALTFFGAH